MGLRDNTGEKPGILQKSEIFLCWGQNPRRKGASPRARLPASLHDKETKTEVPDADGEFLDGMAIRILAHGGLVARPVFVG